MNTINEQYWESYLNTIDNITLRTELRNYSKHIINLLRYFHEDWQKRLDVQAGWIPLLITLHNSIAIIEPNYKIFQIKEKFGGLRYYIDYPSDISKEAKEIIFNLIHSAEQQSFTICEICGQQGELSKTNYWFKTRCSVCV